ncbi:MBL fold metallo-hydrolase [Ehrlichia canis]|uniref:Beta-lactamase-like protein n=1 Tax=Ehrlichia canis (strain Jake) TaxID=269484 RepID=A0ACA6AV70_EHRCJ|nr:MBL fold metallo-hydrolase [Ehrlichia canis]AAZ68194.1 Beta-lactamase-like protein [Ehrlichia canis str. Jake]AUO55040.1 MBL fold metallo-hydrolase [Ehrlichia canis]UKC53429.1 MBL fold metallo-hydrolase [Ehrlichia canis]UKC54365.1 MBL fold metallo-hydrolase [Ehrlichia canis]UKC55302.1 MBL fold metallo-hydrolase [Ehrlichia canis]
MKVTILGCGSSSGVPVVGCRCDTCSSSLKYNKRMRSSILVESADVQLLVDTTPDLRFQALQNNLSSVDAVLYTHFHADHCDGIADLQQFLPKHDVNNIPIYSDITTLCLLTASNSYFFIPSGHASVSKKCSYLKANVIYYYKEFVVKDFHILAIKQIHGVNSSNGFIFNNVMAYCTDVKSFPEESWKFLYKKKVLIIGCLKYDASFGHAHVDLCLDWVKELRPEVAILTHMSHDLEYYSLIDYIKSHSKDNIIVGYDGMQFNIQ